jgi:tetratricopeptide (TPR) repeat protein
MKQPRWIYYYAAATVGLLTGFWTARAEVRFDHVVRNDFFSGFTGNSEALARGMKVCEQVLAENPNHAEALVWHGAGLFFQSGQLFQQGKREEGMQMSARAMGEMDKAVALEPDSIGVRIPRGAALLAATRFMPDSPFRASLFQRAIDDHQHVFNLHKKDQTLDKIGSHPLGELLQALGDSYSRTGEAAKAEQYYGHIQTMLPNTVYAKRAAKWMETKQPLPVAEAQCVGCHVKK